VFCIKIRKQIITKHTVRVTTTPTCYRKKKFCHWRQGPQSKGASLRNRFIPITNAWYAELLVKQRLINVVRQETVLSHNKHSANTVHTISWWALQFVSMSHCKLQRDLLLDVMPRDRQITMYITCFNIQSSAFCPHSVSVCLSI
jgi:hypothetical protein